MNKRLTKFIGASAAPLVSRAASGAGVESGAGTTRMFVRKNWPSLIAIAALSFALSAGFAPSSRAADDFKLILEPAEKSDAKGPVVEVETDKAPAVTTKDPQIALDDLELLLAPMTKAELEVEAKGWFDLVRAKEREISAAELDVHRKNREIGQLEKQKAAAAELAKATQEVKADAGGAASEKDKAAAAERLAEAQKKLVKTVETAKKEKVRRTKRPTQRLPR